MHLFFKLAKFTIKYLFLYELDQQFKTQYISPKFDAIFQYTFLLIKRKKDIICFLRQQKAKLKTTIQLIPAFVTQPVIGQFSCEVNI